MTLTNISKVNACSDVTAVFGWYLQLTWFYRFLFLLLLPCGICQGKLKAKTALFLVPRNQGLRNVNHHDKTQLCFEKVEWKKPADVLHNWLFIWIYNRQIVIKAFFVKNRAKWWAMLYQNKSITFYSVETLSVRALNWLYLCE